MFLQMPSFLYHFFIARTCSASVTVFLMALPSWPVDSASKRSSRCLRPYPASPLAHLSLLYHSSVSSSFLFFSTLLSFLYRQSSPSTLFFSLCFFYPWFSLVPSCLFTSYSSRPLCLLPLTITAPLHISFSWSCFNSKFPSFLAFSIHPLSPTVYAHILSVYLL